MKKTLLFSTLFALAIIPIQVSAEAHDMTNGIVKKVDMTSKLSTSENIHPRQKDKRDTRMRLIKSEAVMETGADIMAISGGTKETHGQTVLISYSYKGEPCMSHGVVMGKLSENKTSIHLDKMYCKNGSVAIVNGFFHDEDKMLGAKTTNFIDGVGRTIYPQKGFVSIEVYDFIKNPMSEEKTNEILREAKRLIESQRIYLK